MKPLAPPPDWLPPYTPDGVPPLNFVDRFADSLHQLLDEVERALGVVIR